MTKVAFTRPADRIADSIRKAEEMGLEAYAAPSLEVLDGHPGDYDGTERFLSEGKADYVVFGSSTAVEKCVERFGRERFKDLMSRPIIVAIGPSTADALHGIGGVDSDIIPKGDHSSYGVVEAIGDDVKDKTVLLVRSDSGSDVLSEGLEDKGAHVVDFAAYRLVKVGMTEDLARIMDMIADGSMDVMAFTSPMSAESFIDLMGERYGPERAREFMRKVKVAAIGRPTAMRLDSLGRAPDIVPERTTFDDMLKVIRDSS